MCYSIPSSPETAEEAGAEKPVESSPAILLQAIRRAATTLPEWALLDLTPVRWNLEPGKRYWRELWKAKGHNTLFAGKFRPTWLAMDLDDTLLMGSFTLGAAWGGMGGGLDGLDLQMLKTDWLATAKRSLLGRSGRVFSRKKHPFLHHPKVEIAFRPGLLEGLIELKNAGIGVVLVTASAEERVNWLRKRFPDFSELLSGDLARVVSAEAMVAVTRVAALDPQSVEDPASARAHALRPRSLAAKTPWAVSRAGGIPFYDLLIDDSTTTAHIFQQSGLSHRLLFIEGRHPWSGYGIHVLDTAVKKLLHGNMETSTPCPLPCPPEFSQIPEGIPVPPKVEDALYYPLLHYRDQF